MKKCISETQLTGDTKLRHFKITGDFYREDCTKKF